MQNNTFSTLFVGQNLIKLSSVDSTNNYLRNLLSKSEPLPEGTVIMADEQFDGKGQLNNRWVAEPGKNLTFSVLLTPTFLPVEKQFLLNIAVSLAINSALRNYLIEGLSIKWPNDIYFESQKLGGVLIENTLAGNTIKSAIVGIGINVNQTLFNAELAVKATSIRQILHRDVDLADLLTDICRQMEGYYLQLRAGKFAILKQQYIRQLFRYQKNGKYKVDGQVIEGVLTAVDDTGKLTVKLKGEERQFNFKEIEFLTTTE